MGLLNNFLVKTLLLAAVAFYGFPVFWWSYNSMDDDPPNEYFLSVRFLMSTGLLMLAMGMTYVLSLIHISEPTRPY